MEKATECAITHLTIPVTQLRFFEILFWQPCLFVNITSKLTNHNGRTFCQILRISSICLLKKIRKASNGESLNISENTGKFSLRDLAALTNRSYCISQHGALVNRFPVMMTPIGWSKFPTIVWSVPGSKINIGVFPIRLIAYSAVRLTVTIINTIYYIL